MASIEANCAAVTRFFRFYRNQGVTNMNQTTDYKNKHFSVLGDSISTLEGYSIPEEAAYYARKTLSKVKRKLGFVQLS